MVQRVFVDADVLFSRTLRDWLFLLKLESQGGMFTLGTSSDVIAEVIARIRDKHPQVSGAAIETLRARLVSTIDELFNDFHVQPRMLTGDRGDGHVRAAATDGKFDFLLTRDRTLLADAESDLPPFYEPISPDSFLTLVCDSAPTRVAAVAKKQADYYQSRHQIPDLAGRLRAAGCPNFAARVDELVRGS